MINFIVDKKCSIKTLEKPVTFNEAAEHNTKSLEETSTTDTSSTSSECISSSEYVFGVSRRKIFTRWWLVTRPCKNAVQINAGEGIPPCIEFYVPIWAWPLELLYRLVFGSTKLES